MNNPWKPRFSLGEPVIYKAMKLYIYAMQCSSGSESVYVTYNLTDDLPGVYYAGLGVVHKNVREEDFRRFVQADWDAIVKARETLKAYGGI